MDTGPSGAGDDNLYAVLAERFAEAPRAPCIVTAEGRELSFGDLDRLSARYANALAMAGVEPGERVLAQTEKSGESLCLYLSCLRAGAVYVPVNSAYRDQELEHFLADARPRVAVCSPGAQAALAPLAARHGVARVLTLDAGGAGTLADAAASASPEHTLRAPGADGLAALVYTSGTTGRPKGAMVTHANLISNARTLHAAWGFQAGDVLLHALPLFHVHGLFVATHCALLNLSPMLFLPRFDAGEVIALLHRATVLMGVPTFYVRLLADPRFDAGTCRNVRLFVSGSAPLLPRTHEEFRARTGHAILERYGMSETGMNTSNPLHGERRPGTVGPPLPGVGVRVSDREDRVLATGEVGGIQLEGPNVFRGYWRNPAATEAAFTVDGWFRTGDLGRFDADGYLTIVGRETDLVISGGYNVYPKEVELCIDALDGVTESAVIGVPDPEFGEAVTAVVVRAGDAPGEMDVIAHVKARLAGYKAPKHVHFVADLPRNSMGKIQKNVLRERFGG